MFKTITILLFFNMHIEIKKKNILQTLFLMASLPYSKFNIAYFTFRCFVYRVLCNILNVFKYLVKYSDLKLCLG